MKTRPLALLLVLLLLSPLRAADRENPPGTYTHPGTQFPFPEKVADFNRIEVTKFAPDESDVAAGYKFVDHDQQITITVYVFPAPALAPADTPQAAKTAQFNKALAAVKKEIAGVHTDAKLLSEADFTLKEADRVHNGTKVSYELSFGKPDVSRSDMPLFVEGSWQFEYRISYPKAFEKQAQSLIEKFLASLHWQAK